MNRVRYQQLEDMGQTVLVFLDERLFPERNDECAGTAIRLMVQFAVEGWLAAHQSDNFVRAMANAVREAAANIDPKDAAHRNPTDWEFAGPTWPFTCEAGFDGEPVRLIGYYFALSFLRKGSGEWDYFPLAVEVQESQRGPNHVTLRAYVRCLSGEEAEAVHRASTQDKASGYNISA